MDNFMTTSAQPETSTFLRRFRNSQHVRGLGMAEGRDWLQRMMAHLLMAVYGRSDAKTVQISGDEYALLKAFYEARMFIHQVMDVALMEKQRSTCVVLSLDGTPVLTYVQSLRQPSPAPVTETCTILDEQRVKELVWLIVKHRSRNMLSGLTSMCKPVGAVQLLETPEPLMSEVVGGFCELSWQPNLCVKAEVEMFNKLLDHYPAYRLKPEGELERVLSAQTTPVYGNGTIETPSRTLFTTDKSQNVYLDASGEVLFFVCGEPTVQDFANLKAHADRPSFWTADVKVDRSSVRISLAQHVQGRASALRDVVVMQGKDAVNTGRAIAKAFPAAVPGLLSLAHAQLNAYPVKFDWSRQRRWMSCRDNKQLRRWPAQR